MHFRRAFAFGVAAMAGTTVLVACGTSNTTARTSTGSTRIVEITMTDMKYTPSSVNVKRGDTVTFRFRNAGQAVHEATIGDAAFQADHGTNMSTSTMDGIAMGEMAMGGQTDGTNSSSEMMIAVKPAGVGELTYTFDQTGGLIIGCHQPGHYEAGMRAMVNVG